MRRFSNISALIGCLFLVPNPAGAAADIGRAVAVQPSVDGVMQNRRTVLQKDDRVIEDEVISTGDHGKTQLLFIDATNLSVGPSSQVILDKFVFAGKNSAKAFVLNATVGAFRFTTGHSAHQAYEIRTPAAVIGVRGTRFAFQIIGRRMSLQVEQGAVIVCPITGHNGCVEARPGEAVRAEAGSLPIIVAAGGGNPTATPPRQGFLAPVPLGIGIGLGLQLGAGGLRPPRLPGLGPGLGR